MWEKSLKMFLEYPLTGVGPGGWKIALPLYGTEGLRSASGRIHFVRPHNDFLWVLSETGIFGLLSFMAIFVMVFIYLFRLLLTIKEAETKLLLLLMGFGIIAYLLVSMVSFPRERIFHSMILMVMMAIVISFYHQQFQAKAVLPGRIVLPVNIIFLLILGFSVWVGYSRFMSEVYLRAAFAAQKQKDYQQEIIELNKTETVFFEMDAMATPISFYRGMSHVRLNQIEAAEADLKKAYETHPNHIFVLLNYGVACDRKGDIETAQKLFEKTLKISPRHEQALINLTGVYYRQEKYQLASETLAKCDPNSNNPKIMQYRGLIEKALDIKNQ